MKGLEAPCSKTGLIQRQFNLTAYQTSPYTKKTEVLNINSISKEDALPFVLDAA